MTISRFRANGRIWILRAILILLLALNLYLISFFSMQDSATSQKTSQTVTSTIITVTQPSHSKLPPAEQQAAVVSKTNLIRNLAHFVEYVPLGLLFSLLLATFPRIGRIKFAAWMRILAVLLILFTIAGLDEYRQSFVSGRATESTDLLLDCLGGSLGLLLSEAALLLRMLWKRKHRVSV